MTLDEHRRRRVMGWREFCAHVGIAKRTMSNIRDGRPLRMATIRRVSAALGVDPMDVAEFRAAITGRGGRP